MQQDITAHFDGRAIIPDEPLCLKPGQKLRVRIESVDAESLSNPLAAIAALATDMGIENLSTNHKHIASSNVQNED